MGYTKQHAGADGAGIPGILGATTTVTAAKTLLAAGSVEDRAVVLGENLAADHTLHLQKGASSDQLFGLLDFRAGNVAAPPMAEGAGFDTLWGSSPSFVADGLLISHSSTVVFDVGSWIGHTREVTATVLLSSLGGADVDRDYVCAGLALNGDTFAECGGLIHWGTIQRQCRMFATASLAAKLSQDFSTATVYQSWDPFPADPATAEYKLRFRVLRMGLVSLPRDAIYVSGSKGANSTGSGNAGEFAVGRTDFLTERASAGKLMISHAWPNVKMTLKHIEFAGVKNG